MGRPRTRLFPALVLTLLVLAAIGLAVPTVPEVAANSLPLGQPTEPTFLKPLAQATATPTSQPVRRITSIDPLPPTNVTAAFAQAREQSDPDLKDVAIQLTSPHAPTEHYSYNIYRNDALVKQIWGVPGPAADFAVNQTGDSWRFTWWDERSCGPTPSYRYHVTTTYGGEHTFGDVLLGFPTSGPSSSATLEIELCPPNLTYAVRDEGVLLAWDSVDGADSYELTRAPVWRFGPRAQDLDVPSFTGLPDLPRIPIESPEFQLSSREFSAATLGYLDVHAECQIETFTYSLRAKNEHGSSVESRAVSATTRVPASCAAQPPPPPPVPRISPASQAHVWDRYFDVIVCNVRQGDTFTVLRGPDGNEVEIFGPTQAIPGEDVLVGSEFPGIYPTDPCAGQQPDAQESFAIQDRMPGCGNLTARYVVVAATNTDRRQSEPVELTAEGGPACPEAPQAPDIWEFRCISDEDCVLGYRCVDNTCREENGEVIDCTTAMNPPDELHIAVASPDDAAHPTPLGYAARGQLAMIERHNEIGGDWP